MAEFDGRSDLDGALIVLPEAFNLGRLYSEGGPPTIHRDQMVSDLQTVAKARGIAFVVGLLEPPPADEKPHSSAYFVDANGKRLMCHKEKCDGVGDYTTCPVAPDHENPLVLQDTAILSVICMDVQSSARCAMLAEKARRAAKADNLICVPAAMSSEYFGGAPRGGRIQFRPPDDHYSSRIVFANSDCRGTTSFITSTDWTVVDLVPDSRRGDNCLSLVRLSQ
jgi:hypothetical protein